MIINLIEYCRFPIVASRSSIGGVLRKEDRIVTEMDELKKRHGDKLSPYKYRLWAEMIVGLLFNVII